MSATGLTRIALLGLSLIAVTAQSATLTIGPDQRQSLGLTVYNDNLVTINTAYRAYIPAGETVLDFTAVSPQIIPASAILHTPTESVRISHQEYRAALTPHQLLRSAVGQSVSLVRTHPQSGGQIVQRARVLAAGDGLILEVDGRYETDLDGRRVIYDRLPAGPLLPTLSVAVSSDSEQNLQPVLSYLSGGVSWQADYIASLDEKHEQMELVAMATVANHSGMHFEQAHLALVAGELNTASAAQPRAGMVLEAMAMKQADTVPRVALGDLYEYAVPGLHDLADGSRRQIRLFSVAGVPVSKRFRLAGSAGIYYSALPGEQQLKADSFIDFDNTRERQLGLPLPAGTVRLYAAAVASPEELKFIGSDTIGHTPELAPVSLRTGRAFDISAERRQLGFRRLPVEQPYRQHSEVELSTVVRNAGDAAVTVEVSETFGGDWQLVRGLNPDQQNAQGAVWKVAVPAKGETELVLTVRVRR